jgi:transmembrane 9 superfamily protein 2/4
MLSSPTILGCFIVISLATLSAGFYLPGVAEEVYTKDHRPQLKVNKLTSINTQLPFKYYELPFCRPSKKNMNDTHENLGEVIRGDKIEASVYQIDVTDEIFTNPHNVGDPFTVVECRAINNLPIVDNSDVDCSTPNRNQLKKLEQFIKDKYKVQWILDNLPAAEKKQSINTDNKKKYETGFLVGGIVDGKVYVNNHVDINVVYNDNVKDLKTKDGKGILIIGFEVSPSSWRHNWGQWMSFSEEERRSGKCPDFDTDNNRQFITVPDKKAENKDTSDHIIWTYRLSYEKSNIPWTQRWDVYLQATGTQIHWISIVNSLMIVLFLTGMVAMIMMRTLRADLRRYNQQELSDDEGETGWKLVHGDVFRPPRHPMLLSVLIGSGVQVFGMTVVTLLFAVLGFLSPAQRGYLITAFVVLFVLMGVFAGYFSTRCYRIFKGTHPKKNTINTAFAFPGTVFAIYFVINMCERGVHSSGAVPFGTLVSLVALWFGISVPLVFFGSYFAQRKPLPEDPVRTNQIPRQVPEQVWYMSPVLSVLMGGILPFGAVFIELFFILLALWGNQLYYIFGFLLIVFIILIITCAEITVVMCYFQLCAEDYNWWWRSFLTAGASAFYMFLYAIFYFISNLDIEKFVSGLLYFGYTLIMTIAFFVLTGSIGFYACYFFVRKIYSAIHVD